MLVKTITSVILGVKAIRVDVEVDVAPGMFHHTVVGLPGSSVKESRDRIRTAIRNSGFVYPDKKITVNLAPADIKKEGGFLDLPVAAAMPPLFWQPPGSSPWTRRKSISLPESSPSTVPSNRFRE
jgi:magnesium chelatase family protein